MKIKLTKRAFTLIELLAVIIILAIVALIATPLILNVINDSKRSANLSEAYLILGGAENYYAASILDPSIADNFNGNINIYGSIDTSGEKPPIGDIKIKPNGDIALAIYNEGVCYLKGYEENIITPDETVSEADCVAPSSDTVVLDPLDPANPDYCANYMEHYKDYASLDSNYYDLVTGNGNEGEFQTIWASTFSDVGNWDTIVIPCEVNNVSTGNVAVEVQVLNDSFYRDNSVSQIIIPETVITLGGASFEATAATRIDLPQGLKNIGYAAFHSSRISSMELPDGLLTIGDYAFANTSNLTTITIPSSVTTIGSDVFENSNVTEIIVSGKTSETDFDSIGYNWNSGITVTYQ